jgi:hypothetical protein
VEHVAQSHRVTLELLANGRFELDYNDVSPSGGLVVRMKGSWQSATAMDGAPLIRALPDGGTYHRWRGDLHREHHRRPGDPPYAQDVARRGVATHQRVWMVSATPSGEARIQLHGELRTRVGRAAGKGKERDFPRCDAGEFNPR